MDLFSLSYRIQQNRYRVAPEAVAEAMIRWHLGFWGAAGAIPAERTRPAVNEAGSQPELEALETSPFRLSRAATGEPSSGVVS